MKEAIYFFLTSGLGKTFTGWKKIIKAKINTSLFYQKSSFRNNIEIPWHHKFWPLYNLMHGLQTPREEIAFTARPKIHSQSQIFRYGRSIFCLPHQPNFSDIFDLCLHWVSVVRDFTHCDDIICKIVWKVWTGIKYHALLFVDIIKFKEIHKRH